ncbi:alpha/beta hydrolase [Cellvibrio zantedeschiae]|uniref:Alpha/beta hydrolase n=1 Tax=Cellvibrio zantedeschiae TaxID=1237077 RepID=A0ABQ3B2H1_9GAMM|nr:alpha/beta hydrolase [Cellvibrio zantedeschiae]GGY76666.1 alpha/beta hydrolase [Cellvibrio zantedeschiae]
MFCKKNGGLIAVIIAVAVSMSVANKSNAETFEGLDAKVEGKGAAVVFIPGLNSGASVFNDTCNAIKATNQCHLLQLPGFAGLAPLPANDKDFLINMRDRVEHYLQTKKLKKVSLVGHSLGGTLSLMIAQHSPDLISKVVIVDALPFYSAIQNPAATAELMKPQAEQMRSMMLNQPREDYLKYGAQNLMGMSNNPERLPLLTEWLKTSDSATTANAMYSMMVTDLRKPIADIKAPTLVLGAWAAYKSFGATKESTKAIFTTQYAELKNVDVRMSEAGYHFLMWDDATWVNQQIKDFLSK